MKKIFLLIAILFVVIVISGETTYASPNNLSIDNMEINWSDEFNGTELNKSYWTPQIGNGGGWGNCEMQYYMEKNVAVSDGTMKIIAQYEPMSYGNYNWTSARITSKELVHMGLGYVEAKIKVPSAQGIESAFGMVGTNGKIWPSCGEIDIMQSFNTKHQLQSTVHYPTWSGKDQYLYKLTEMYDKTEWHTYGCYRDGKTIAFYIDRILLDEWSTEDVKTGENAGQCSVLNDDYYILFNVACGGNLAGENPPATQGWNAVMEVDYVRYYKVNNNLIERKKQTITAKSKTVSKDTKSFFVNAKASGNGKLTYSSSNKKVITINSAGKVVVKGYGKATITIKASAAAGYKEAYKKITITVVPKKAILKKLSSPEKKRLSASWKKDKTVSGYQVQFCTRRDFKQGTYQRRFSSSKTRMGIYGLRSGKEFYIRVRAFKNIGKIKYYGAWSKVRKVKIR